MKSYQLAIASPADFINQVNALSEQGFVPQGDLVAYNDGSETGNPVLIQLMVLEEE